MARTGQIEGSQIINYQGNSNLALGGGAGLKVYGETDASGITETARQMALQAHEDQLMLYKQRIADRDKVQKMIDDDEIPLDNILEQNRPYVEGKIKDARDYFYKNVNEILKNPAAYREYKAKLADAKSAAKTANTNYLLFSAEQKELGKTTNTTDANKRKEFMTRQLDKIKNNPNAYIDPYVPIANFDASVVAAPPVYGEAKLRREGDYMITEQTVDPKRTLDAYYKKFLEPQYNDGFLQYVDLFKKNPQQIDAVNKKLAALNQQLGLTGDNAIQPITATDKTHEVAAKIALADNPGVTQKKDYAKEQVQDEFQRAQLREQTRNNKENNAIDWAKIANDKAELQAKKDQWAATQKGGDTTKNAAFEFANRIYSDLTKLADKNGVISPDKIRQMNAEQLRYLGVAKDGDLSELNLKNDEVLQLVNGQVRVLGGAKQLADGSGRWDGLWDQNRSTNIYNIATNRLNEENKVAGSHELSHYMTIDQGTGGVSEVTTGASTTVSGSGSQSTGNKEKIPALTGTVDPSTLKVGNAYQVGGKVYTWNGSKLVLQ